MSYKRLISICSVNVGKADRLRDFIKKDVDCSQLDRGKPAFFRGCTKCSVVLPPFHFYPRELQDIYIKSVIDRDMKDDLEHAKVINWCRTAKPLVPLITTGDGNCLLHSVSLAMWGIEDKDLFLRRLLYVTLVNDQKQTFQRRWVLHQRYRDPSMPEEAHFQLNTVEFEREWEAIKNAASDISTEQEGNNFPYSTLEKIHLFALANILRRPIIVLADKRARSVFGQSLQENNITGIYLPLEWKASECTKSPIILGYNLNHFAPLVSREEEPAGHEKTADNVVMLINKDYSPLVIHFLLPDEETRAADILNDYLVLGNVSITTSEGVALFFAAKIDQTSLPRDLDLVKDHRKHCEQIFQNRIGSYRSNSFPPTNASIPTPTPRNRQERMEDERTVDKREDATNLSIGFGEGIDPGYDRRSIKCITGGCMMFGSPATANLCSKCFKLYTVHYEHENQARRNYRPVVEATAPPPTMPVQESYVDISMMGQLCRTGCGLHCSTETYPYCHECHERIEKDKHLVQMTPKQEPQGATSGQNNQEEMEISEQNMFGSGTSPCQQKMEDAKAKSDTLINIEPELSPELQLICSTPNCKNNAKKEQRNKCLDCFLHSPQDKTSKMILKLSPEKTDFDHEVFSPVDVLGPPLGASLFSEPSIPSPSVKHICATPGCQGVRMDNPTGNCLDCWKKNLGNKARSEPLPASGRPDYGHMESSVLESCNLVEVEESELNPRVKSSKDKVKCASPTCNNMIYPPKKMCDECSEILNQSMAAKIAKDKKRHPATPGAENEHGTTHCKTSGCQYYAMPGTNYCSGCSKTAAKKPKQSASSQPVVTRSNPGIIDMRPTTAPVAKRGMLCQEPGCDKYGDPVNQDRCSFHFNRIMGAMDYQPAARYNRGSPVNFRPISQRNEPFPKQISLSGFRNLENVPKIQTSNTKSPNFDIALKKVENERKSKMKCRNASCTNYGNNQSRGYCNSCYIEACRN